MKENYDELKSEIKKSNKNEGISKKAYTTPVLYPDSRFIKSNTACPSMSNVIREKNWSEFDQL